MFPSLLFSAKQLVDIQIQFTNGSTIRLENFFMNLERVLNILGLSNLFTSRLSIIDGRGASASINFHLSPGTISDEDFETLDNSNYVFDFIISCGEVIDGSKTCITGLIVPAT